MNRAIPMGLVFLTVMVASCARPKGTSFRPEVVEPSKAVVYVYRLPRSWAGRPVLVSIDQQLVGRLDAGQYLARQVEPGQRVVLIVGESDAVRQVSLIAGDSAFLEVHSSYWDGRPTVDLLDEQAAKSRIAQTGRAEPSR